MADHRTVVIPPRWPGYCLAFTGDLLCADRVIVGEFIGANGIGRLIMESEAGGSVGMMVAVIVLMLVGVALRP